VSATIVGPTLWGSLAVCATAALVGSAPVAGGAIDPARVRVEACLGVDPCLVIEAPGPRVTATVVPGEGGRLVQYGIGGENILWQEPDAQGRPQARGGYQCDVGPEMRLIPAHPVLWSGKYAWSRSGPASLELTSAPCPVLGLRMERELSMDPGAGRLSIVQRMKNLLDREQSYCLWDRTLCKAGGFALIPLNENSRFPAHWVLGKRQGGAWVYDGTNPAHENVKAMDGVLVCRSSGPEQKVGADSDAGWIAYVLETTLLVKYFPCDPAGNYTDGGLSVAHYFNERVAELEPIGPEVRLRPGEHHDFPEVWTIVRLDAAITTHAQARALVASIPPSPFDRRTALSPKRPAGQNDGSMRRRGEP
jgi:hypothetical protein